MIYKIKKLIKSIFYIFVTKKTLITIIIFLFILLISKNVFAFTYDGCNFIDNSSAFLSALENLTEYQDGWYYITRVHGTYGFEVAFLDKDATTNFRSYISRYTNTLFRYHLSSSTPFTVQWYQFNTNTNTFTAGHRGVSSGSDVMDTLISNGNVYFNCNFDVYTDNTYTTLFYEASEEPIYPYILDSKLNLGTLSMNYITVDSGNQSLYNDNIDFFISTRPQGSSIGSTVYATGLNPSSEFYNANGVNGAYYEIPVSSFKDFLTEGYEITYTLQWRNSENQAQINISDISVLYNPSAETVDDIELLNNNINSNFNKLNNVLIQQFGFLGDLIGNKFENLSQEEQERFLQQYAMLQQQYASQRATEDATKDTNQFLKNDNFSSGNINLPSDGNQDITQDGINNIFTMIYNAFTSGIAPDIIIPIPFTGQSFTIPANYLQTILSNTSFSFISNIIELFWWYVISVFIIKDISKKMNKIKSGDVENLENSNIKEDML